jgi:S1-C subfamily serine protease
MEIEKNGSIHIGTGFLVESSACGSIIVSVKHNVDPEEGVQFSRLVGPDSSSYILPTPQWQLHPTADLAFIPVQVTGAQVPINLAVGSEMLEETISLGFPKVSTSDDAYLLAHSGELNAKITSYQDRQQYLLISNAVSPGSSGSPVLNLEGEAIGIVVRSFETEHEGGVTAVNSAIPASMILQFIERKG